MDNCNEKNKSFAITFPEMQNVTKNTKNTWTGFFIPMYTLRVRK